MKLFVLLLFLVWFALIVAKVFPYFVQGWKTGYNKAMSKKNEIK